jgi:hypothetical protein
MKIVALLVVIAAVYAASTPNPLLYDPCSCTNAVVQTANGNWYRPTPGSVCHDWDGSGYQWCYVNDGWCIFAHELPVS